MNNPVVTIIIATYNRPAVLEIALRSVMAQTFQDWKVLVVGDNCDERTGILVRQLNCEKIEYHNLPVRFGEQSGPNSIGMALAHTEYIALLNHDDIWLADHLERSLQTLQEKQVDFLLAKTAALKRHKKTGRITFRVMPDLNSWDEVFYQAVYRLEPCSAWIFKRHVFQALGYWSSAIDIYRTPLVDWALRMGRKKITWGSGKDITVLKMNTHIGTQLAQGEYAASGQDHWQVYQNISSTTPEQARDKLSLWFDKNSGMADLRQIKVDGFPGNVYAFLLLNKIMARIYFNTGWDAYSVYAKLVGLRKGEQLRQACKRRTGQDVVTTHAVEPVLQQLMVTPKT